MASHHSNKAEYDNGVSGMSRDGLAGSTCTAPPAWVRILNSLDPCESTMGFLADTLSKGTIKVGEAWSDLVWWIAGPCGLCFYKVLRPMWR